MFSYWWSIRTNRLPCTGDKIWCLKNCGVTTLTFWGGDHFIKAVVVIRCKIALLLPDIRQDSGEFFFQLTATSHSYRWHAIFLLWATHKLHLSTLGVKKLINDFSGTCLTLPVVFSFLLIASTQRRHYYF